MNEETINSIIRCNERATKEIERLKKDYKTKADKIIEEIEIVENCEINEYNFCKFIDKIRDILKVSGKE